MNKDTQANKLLPNISNNAWDLPSGYYYVSIDRATKGSKDYSCRVWMERGISGAMIIVAVEHLKPGQTERISTPEDKDNEVRATGAMPVLEWFLSLFKRSK